MIPDCKGEKLMVKVRKCIKYYHIITEEGYYNSIHNKSVYEVKYLYGMVNQLTSNIIAKNILSNFDSEYRQYQLLTEVNYHNIYDIAIAKVDGFIKSSNGKLHRKRKTRLYRILVGWRYVSVYWITIKDLKQSNPVELSEYSVVNEISGEPDFIRWVKETLGHIYSIISRLKFIHWHTS